MKKTSIRKSYKLHIKCAADARFISASSNIPGMEVAIRKEFQNYFFHISELRRMRRLSGEDEIGKILDRILIPRFVDSAGSETVRKFISEFLSELGFFVELDAFSQDTVVGRRHFSNIIARSHPERSRQLILGANT